MKVGEGRLFRMVGDFGIGFRKPQALAFITLHLIAVALAVLSSRTENVSGSMTVYFLFIACLFSDILVPFILEKANDDESRSIHDLFRSSVRSPMILGALAALPVLFPGTVVDGALMAVSAFGIVMLHFVFCVGVATYVSSALPSRFYSGIVSVAGMITFDVVALAAGLSPVSVFDLLDSVMRGSLHVSSMIAYGITALFFPALIVLRGSGKGRMKYISCLVSAALLCVLAMQHDRPFDLTRERYHTISPFTESVLSRLESELLVTWYRSDLPGPRDPERTLIEDMLGRYRRASGRLFAIDEVTVDTDTTAYPGMTKGASIIPGRRDIAEAYSGFVLEYRGRTAIIPYLRDARSMEYTLTKRIQSLVADEGTAPIELYQGNSPESGAYAYLEQYLADGGFSVRHHQSGIDATSGDILIIGSRYIDESAVASIRSRLRKGSNAVFLVSGTTVHISGDWSADPKEDDPLLRLLDELGVSVGRTILLDLPGFNLAIQSLDGSSIARVPYPYWISFESTDFPRGHALFSGMETLHFFWPSAITLDPSIDGQSLLETDDDALEALPPYDMNPFGTVLPRGQENPSSGARSLVSSLSMQSSQRVLVVSDELLPSSMIEYTGSRDNLDFIVNCLEWVAGHDDLLSLKKARLP